MKFTVELRSPIYLSDKPLTRAEEWRGAFLFGVLIGLYLGVLVMAL